MIEEKLRILSAQGRSQSLEVLPSEASHSVIASTLAAFANSQQGGILIVDVDGDTGTVIDQVLQAALALVPPLLISLPQAVEAEGKTLVIVEVPAGMPHVYAYEGRYLIRQGVQDVPLHPRDLRRLLIERGEISFEIESPPGTSLDDLQWDKVKAYAVKAGAAVDSDSTVEAFLLRRGCLTQTSSGLRPTHAGLLLFGKDVQSRLRGAEITAVRFGGTMMSDTFNRQDIVGTLPDQIRRAETFLRDHLRKDVILHDGMERTERYEYPLEAARELVVNAVAHRDYSTNGDGIRLYLFADHMEITSPGRLPGPVTISNITDERFSRNPALVQVLADLGFIERLGYGVDRVIELMRQQGLRAPEFYETDGGFRVTLYNQVDALRPPLSTPALTPTSTPVTASESPPIPSVATVLSVTSEVAQELLSEYHNVALNPRQEAALVYLKLPGNTRITNSELQRLYPDVHPETVRRDLSDLVTKNLLNKMGEKRGSYYVLRREAVAE